MNLARGRNGRIGVQIPGQGLQARVKPTYMGDQPGNLYLSEAVINKEAHRRASEKALAAGKKRYNQLLGAAANLKQNQALAARRAQVQHSQQAKKFDPMNEKLKHHFARQKAMGQTEMVATTLYHQPSWSRGTTGSTFKPRPPADFSNSGANMDTVPSDQVREPVVWHSDYRMHMIKGNPLTRDGKFGPAVTDYDRFVNGQDVNDAQSGGGGNGTETLAGGTMLGRLNGSPVRAGLANRGGRPGLGDEFDDFESDDSSSGGFFSDLWDSATSTITDALPGAALSQVTGSGSHPTGTTTTVYQPIPGTVTTATMIPGIPNWALYSGLGLMGLGVVFAMLSAVKKA